MHSQPVFDAFADPTRRRILALLAQQGELCVCELTAALELGQPKISRHLAVLKDVGLVTPRRAGTWMHYRIDSTLPIWITGLLKALSQGGVPDLAADLARLDQMHNRPERCAT
jgi:DNA-binding transcriptional ArsR family regulator